jgi:Mg-chelatase subunit ChlD
LFILDISGSMDQAPKTVNGEGPKPPKIEVARKELLGFLLSFDEGARFNLIFFNHEVVPWQQKMVESTETNKRRVRKWIEDQEPLGGTNIHDALEAGFGIAMRVTGEPVVDTIFFLTDGRPTAGKIQDPERILEAVADWNRTARLTIHCVGVGDHDAEFMQQLAKIGGGEYRRR